jgi:hypothetical protein
MLWHYCPEMDESPLLDDIDTTLFQEVIGILHWAIELGRINIMLEVSLLSSHLAMPRENHLHNALHILSYLHHKSKLSIYMNPVDPPISEDCFHAADWTDFYRHSVEPLPDVLSTLIMLPTKLRANRKLV